jgi:hypothetical protein
MACHSGTKRAEKKENWQKKENQAAKVAAKRKVLT